MVFFVEAFRFEEYIVRLKSRAIWIKVSDRNTTFFPNQVIMCLNKNVISEIQYTKGNKITSLVVIHEEVHRNFKARYTNKGGNN